MSIMDFILQDKPLLLTIIAAGAVMLLAVILFFVAQIRALLFRIRAMNDEAIDILNGVDDETEEESLPIAAPVQAAASAASAPSASAPPAEEQPEVASDMQKLIESVFTDEELATRRASLIESSQPVDIRALAALTAEVAEALRAKAEAAT